MPRTRRTKTGSEERRTRRKPGTFQQENFRILPVRKAVGMKQVVMQQRKQQPAPTNQRVVKRVRVSGRFSGHIDDVPDVKETPGSDTSSQHSSTEETTEDEKACGSVGEQDMPLEPQEEKQDQVIADYERQRMENMRRNAGILAKLGISSAVGKLSSAVVRETHSLQREPSAGTSRKRKSRERDNVRRSVRTRAADRSSSVAQKTLLDRCERFLQSGESDSEEDDDSDLLAPATTVHEKLPSHKGDLDDSELTAYTKLVAWRNAQAEEGGVSKYMILHNRSLCEMIRLRPATITELSVVWGMASTRIEKYGETLLGLLSELASHLRRGHRPVLDTQDDSGVAVTSEPRGRGPEAEEARAGKVLATGDKWKKLEWAHLDRLKRRDDATVTLRHNASNVFRKTVSASDSLAQALQHIAHIGKKKANPKITGFIKVVENARLDDVPLALLLEGAASALMRETASSA